MTQPSAPTPTPAPQGSASREERHLEAELGEIRSIYEILYPEHALDAHLWWEQAPCPTPAVLEEEAGLGAQHLGLSYLGQTAIGDRGAGRPRKQLHLTIPRLPTPGELQEGYTPWAKRPRRFRAVFQASPLLFEHGKYRVERRQEQQQTRRHNFRKLPLSRNIRFTGGLARRSSAKPPAILIGFHWLEVGGAENLAFDTVAWALEAGLRVFVVSDLGGPQRAAHKLPDDPNVHFLRTDRYLPRHLFPAFVQQLIAQENVVMTHNHHCTLLYDTLPAIKSAFPDVVNADSTHITEYGDGGYPRISGVWSNFLDVHHVISQDLKDFYDRHFSPGSKLRLGRLLDPAIRQDTPAAPRITAGQKTCRIAFVGRMVHQKRPVVAVAIMRRLLKWGRSNGVAFQFDMVGEGAYREAVEYLIRRYRLRQAVTLHPADSDVPALLGQADAVLMPSANEGLALVCYEAIAAGCVPVATDVGAQREIVPQGTLVHRAPYRTVAESAAAIQRLLTDQAFTDAVCTGMQEKFAALRDGPLAKEVLMPLYQKAAAGSETAVAAQ